MVDRRPADTSSRLGDGRAAIVFDGDDTLWETEPLYDKARSTAASIAASAGYSAFDFEDLQKVIDADNVRLMGLASHRFPTSSVQAYEELARRAHNKPIQSVSRAIYDASSGVFRAAAPLMPFAHELLSILHPKFALALLTD